MAALSGGEMCVKYLMFAFNLVFWVTEGVVNDNFLLPTHFLTYLFGFLSGKTLDNKCIYTEYFVCFMNMAVAGGIKCVKYLMFAFNFVFWLAGTAVFAIGLWLRLDPKTKGLFEGSDSPYVFYTGVYILIGAGALMMVVGFLGCCGAIQESPCMLGLFFFFLLIIFAIELAAGIWGFSNQSKVVNDITIFYKQTYNNYMVTGDERFKETLRVIHTGLNCCGPTGTISDGAKDTCPRGEILELLITKSCPDAIDEVFDSKLHIIGGVGVTIGVIMMFGMIFSMLLCCAIRKSREVV